MAKLKSFGQAMSHSAGELLGLLSVLSQFFGAFNALKLNWINVAIDLRPWAAGLSTLISIGGFALGWHAGGVLDEEKPKRKLELLRRTVIVMLVSYLAYWWLNVTYTTGSPNRHIDTAARLGFLVLYAMPFGSLSYLLGLLAEAKGD
jgi:hypothetical protein